MNMKPIVDINSLRTEHESDQQWEVRRNFMEQHKDDFEEDKLIALAQLFSDIEFWGCRYPAEAMKLIAELSESLSESRKHKLKRTLIQAIDTAEQKAKRNRIE